MSKKGSVRVRLLFADQGSFHHEEVDVDGKALEKYDRLIDFLREDEDFLKRMFVDVERLCSATVVDG